MDFLVTAPRRGGGTTGFTTLEASTLTDTALGGLAALGGLGALAALAALTALASLLALLTLLLLSFFQFVLVVLVVLVSAFLVLVFAALFASIQSALRASFSPLYPISYFL